MIGLTGTTTGYGANAAELAKLGIRLGNSAVPTTGLYSPGADQLALSTAGTGRLFVTSDGNVGIGTQSPLSPLHISRSGSGDIDALIAGTPGAFNGSQALCLGTYTAAGTAQYGCKIRATYNYASTLRSELAFETNFTGTTPVERMRITYDGKVGIGTSAPTFVLDTRGADSTNVAHIALAGLPIAPNSYAGLSFGYQGNTTGSIRLGFDNPNASANSYFAFYTTGNSGTNERLRITSDGNVGIGTSSPGQALDVVGAINSQGNASTVVHFQAQDTGAATDEKTWRIAQTNRTNKTLLLGVSVNDAANTAYTPITITRSGTSLDNIQFATGTGAERARIDSSGRLLVGTSTALTGSNSQYAKNVTLGNSSSTTGDAILAIGRGSIGTGLLVNQGVGTITFTDNSAAEFASITCATDAATSASDYPGRLVFSTTADGAASPTERMRITNGGVVGIGDTNPSANAIRASFRGPVNGTESALPVVSIVRTNNIAGGTGVAETGLDVRVPYTFNGAGDVKGINVYANHNVFGTTYGIFAEAVGSPNASNRYSGYFKITQGDTNGPAINYAIYAQANATIGATNAGYSIGVTSETSDYLNNRNFQATSLYTGAATQTVLGITRNSVAIGGITTIATATNYQTSSSSGLFGVDATTVAVRTNNSERARLDSSGRLLVGTSTARAAAAIQASLQIETTNYVGSSLVNNTNDTGGAALVIGKTRSTSVGGATIVQNNDNLGDIYFVGADGVNLSSVAARITAAVDGTPGANDMPGRLVFSTTADGAATPTEAMRINNQRELLIGTTTRTANGGVLQISNGITFPGTQSACSDPNTLDDYEEGTWTPTDGSAAALTFTSTSGTYVKIGRMVYASCALTYPSTATANTAYISGLPFNQGNTGIEGGFITNNTSSTSLLIRGYSLATVQPVSLSGTAVANSALSSASIRLTCVYSV